MSLKRFLRLRHTLAFRLTLWYAGIFTISISVAFLIFYLIISSVIYERVDQDLVNELKEFSSLLALKGIDVLKTNMVLEAESEGVDKTFFRLAGLKGEVLASSNMSSWGNAGMGRTALRRLAGGAEHVFETLCIPGYPHEVRILYGMVAPGKILQIGRSLEDDERFIEAFREIFSTSMAVIMVFAALVGWFMARRALRGVEEVTRTAQHISDGALERRVSVKTKGEEIDRLATTFNSMLDRIHALVTGMREMSDNIAHDLRSPITRIRGIAEMTLTAGKSIHEYEAMAANTVEECDRLLEMINTMLDISEAEAGTGKLIREQVDISGMVRDACELFQPIAEDKCVALTSRIPASFYANGDRQRLQRMVANLLDNALKYTASGGAVAVSVNGDKERAVISVTDTGVGISEEDLPHIFKRLYRSDQSRPQAGSGLGLSLALAIARAHGGDIAVESSPGKGSTFRVTLPMATLPH